MIKRTIIERQPFVLIAIFILAIILRMNSLSARPLWYDEAFSILYSEKGLRAMVYGTLAPVNGVASDIHPPAILCRPPESCSDKAGRRHGNSRYPPI